MATMSAAASVNSLLLPEPEVVQVTKWRWWVLAVYTFSSALQGIVWAVPGLTAQTMRLVYNISESTTDLLVNYGDELADAFKTMNRSGCFSEYLANFRASKESK